MWNRTTIDMGNVQENSSLAFSFFQTGVVTEVELKPSCGCTKVKWIADTNTITGSINVGRFPAHLKEQGLKTFQLMKTITVSYSENGNKKTDLLIIKATLI